MSLESQQDSDQSPETVFDSWLIEFKGKFWLNTDIIPKDVYAALQAYKHWKDNIESEETASKMAEAAKKFEELTGYNIQDFFQYKEEKNQSLSADKK